MDKASMNAYLKNHEFSTYERDNYDKFLKKEKFSFPIKSIHISGTNGKGSTAYYLYNIYQITGYKVGLFHSPFLNDVTEMIEINKQKISDEEYLNLFNEYHQQFQKYNLSSFEIETFIAYTYFLRKEIDVAIIEVGMGGYIDATNIITPILSIITSVSLEHTAYLGRSISEIASNKAGIIKEGVPALIGRLDQSAIYAIKEHAKYYESPLHIVNEYHNERIEDENVVFDYYPLTNIKLKTKALYQCKNASLAIEALNILKDILPTDEKAIRNGLFSDNLPCRYEKIKENIILDGAHNPEAIISLCETIIKSENKPIHVLFAVFKDKNVDSMLNELQKEVSSILLTTFDHKRARNEEDFFLYLGDYEFIDDYKVALNSLLEKYPNDLILVTGSLAFTAKIREYLK